MTKKPTLPTVPDPVNARPEEMSYEEYRTLRKETNNTIKNRLKKGVTVFVSNEVLFDSTGNPVGLKYKRSRTFVGSTRELKVE